MICLRGLQRRLPSLTPARFLNHGDVSETADRRKVFYNAQKESSENWRMIKEMEVPDMSADTEKPGRPTIDRYVPKLPLKPVKAVAPMPSEVQDHAPVNKDQYMYKGRLEWKKKDGCLVCNNDLHISYKDVALLYQFVSHNGQILGPHKTGLCQLSHHMVVSNIEIARDLGLMAVDYKPLEFQDNGVFHNPEIKDVGW